MDKYLKMFEPPMKKWLAEHYSPEKAKARWERTIALHMNEPLKSNLMEAI